MLDYTRDRLAGDLSRHFLLSHCAMLNDMTNDKIMQLVFALEL